VQRELEGGGLAETLTRFRGQRQRSPYTVILFLTLLSDSRLNGGFVPRRASSAAPSSWHFPVVETGLRSLRDSLSGKGVTNQKLFVYRTIKYNKWDGIVLVLYIRLVLP
jgi:hypothetical protein